jgi:aryl-alcohol dehydrogenase-like predicted oxidoreductase
MGYGAMQLAGPGVFGPPRDVDAAITVLREAVDSGVNHIDTSDFYGPHVTNQIIKQALHPYPDDLVIVTKVGARRGEDGSWLPALSRQQRPKNCRRASAGSRFRLPRSISETSWSALPARHACSALLMRQHRRL